MEKRITIDGKLSAKEIRQKAEAAVKLYGGPLRGIMICGDFICDDGFDYYMSCLEPIVKLGKTYISVLYHGVELKFDPTKGFSDTQFIQISVECANNIN